MLTVEFVIATLNHGIARVMEHLLPPQEGVSYLITWQQTDEDQYPDTRILTERKDVRLLIFHDKGLSKNRNHGLAHAQGDILVIADDDSQYLPESAQRIRQAYQQYPEAQILLFQATDHQGHPIKKYAPQTYVYPNGPRYTYISSWEITLKRQKGLPKFDERFGLGSPYLACGEEEVFIHEAHRKKALIRYVPTVIVQTDKDTTGTHFLTDVKVRHAKGGVLYLFHGYIGAVLRCLKYALRLKSPHQFHYFKDMYDGINYIRKSK